MIDEELLHSQTANQLKSVIKSPSHAYLFYGSAHSGKKRAALTVAAELARTKVSQRAFEQILRGNHHHLQIIEPIEGKSIKLSQVKEVLRDLSLKTFEDDLIRVVIVDEAQKLGSEAANSLLKALEEPPDNTIFFILSSSLAQVLPTIVSRCVQIAFLPIDDQELRRQVEKKLGSNSKAIDEIIDCAEGRPALAISLAEDENKRNKYKAVRVLAEGFAGGSVTTRFKIAQEVSAQKEASFFITALIGLKRKEFLQEGRNHAGLEKLLDTESNIERNVNARLAIEYLALEL